MQDSANILRQRLLIEIQGRAWSFSVPQIPCLLVFLIFNPDMYHENVYFLLGTILVAVGAALFTIPVVRIAERTDACEKIFMAGALFCSFGWSAILTAFFHDFGMLARNSLLTVVIVCGINAGAFILLTPVKKLFNSYFLPISLIPPMYAIYVARDMQDVALFALMVIYNCFLIFSSPPIRQRFHNAILNELSLAEEKGKMEAMINAFPGIVSIIDDQHHYQMMNRVGHEMLGCTDVSGKPLGFITPEDDFVHSVRDFLQDTTAQRVTKEMLVNTGQGVHWFLVSMNRLPNPQGWVVVVSVLIDELVSARKNAEEQKAKADYTSRLASLGEMAQGIAHEINNPLAVVLFSADEIHQRAKRQDLDGDFIINFSGKILMMSQRIAKIVKGLRYFSRDAEKDPFRAVPVSVILEQTIDFRMEKCKSSGIKLEILPYDEALMVECREVQIMQALINLLSNAHDAVIGRTDPWIRVEVRGDEKSVHILISDSGPGITPEQQVRMFEPFFTTKEVGQGTGLGLSISLGLLQDNAGELRFLGNNPTRFEMILPKSH